MNFSSTEINKLYENTYETFKNIPQVAKIAIYGSTVKRFSDQYSDLDIEIQLSEWNSLSSKLESIFRKVGDPFVIFPAINDPGNGVMTVLWRNFPFYQKLDMRLLTLDATLSEESEVVYEGKSKLKNEKPNKSFKLSFEESYRPFYDLFIGATRYTKHRKRGEFLSAYKFYRSGYESLIRLYYFDIKQLEYTTNSLTIEDLKKLDREDKSLAEMFSKYMTVSPKSIDENYINLLERYLNESSWNGLIKKSSLEQDFGQNVIQFVRNELLGA